MKIRKKFCKRMIDKLLQKIGW